MDQGSRQEGTVTTGGRTSTRARSHARVVVADPPTDQVKDEIMDEHVEVLVPIQHPEDFIASVVFQEAWPRQSTLLMH